MKCQIQLSWKNKKNIINLSSTKFSQRVVKVKETMLLLYIGSLNKTKTIICPSSSQNFNVVGQLSHIGATPEKSFYWNTGLA